MFRIRLHLPSSIVMISRVGPKAYGCSFVTIASNGRSDFENIGRAFRVVSGSSGNIVACCVRENESVVL